MKMTTRVLSILVLVLAAPQALAEVEGTPDTQAPAEVEGTPDTQAPAEVEATPVTKAPAGDDEAVASEASPPPVTGSVARASFTTAVLDHEPQDSVTSLTTGDSKILFFTELRDLEGQTVTHVWERDGVEMARVPFVVGAARWRVYSTKNLEPSWLGEWTEALPASIE
jgi:hypothetical protein